MSEKVISGKYLFFASSLLFLSFIMKDLILQVRFGLVKEKVWFFGKIVFGLVCLSFFV